MDPLLCLLMLIKLLRIPFRSNGNMSSETLFLVQKRQVIVNIEEKEFAEDKNDRKAVWRNSI